MTILIVYTIYTILFIICVNESNKDNQYIYN